MDRNECGEVRTIYTRADPMETEAEDRARRDANYAPCSRGHRRWQPIGAYRDATGFTRLVCAEPMPNEVPV